MSRNETSQAGRRVSLGSGANRNPSWRPLVDDSGEGSFNVIKGPKGWQAADIQPL